VAPWNPQTTLFAYQWPGYWESKNRWCTHRSVITVTFPTAEETAAAIVNGWSHPMFADSTDY
jgi:hypothetical protein